MSEANEDEVLAAEGERPEVAAKRVKGIYVGAPACFLLERECQQLYRAFCCGDDENDEGYHGGIYLVGSALKRPDWRDIDVRLMLSDKAFNRLFPHVVNANWEFDPRWLIMTVAISAHLSKVTGLPIDFQFQRQTEANATHKGFRNALGLEFVRGVPLG